MLTGRLTRAVAPLASRTMASTEWGPLVGMMMVTGLPWASMVPSLSTSHVNAYGPVPPEADASQLMGLPAVPFVQEALMTSGWGSIVNSLLKLATAPLASLTIRSTETGPFVAKVQVNWGPKASGLPSLPMSQLNS